MNYTKIISRVKDEEKINRGFLHLTANENQMSNTARYFLNSKLSERYYFGRGLNGIAGNGIFTCLGLGRVADLVEMAIESAKKMLNAESINLSCLSGVHAMMCTILSVTEPGDYVITVHHNNGGHFATKGILERVGRKQLFAAYDVENNCFDYEQIVKDCTRFNVKAIYFDISYYLEPIMIEKLRLKINPKTVIIFDASHTLGLIMGKAFSNPFSQGADVICGNTHKTLPGPQKGMVSFKHKDLGDKANRIIDSCLYSSAHTHHLLSLAVTILEMDKFGESYAAQVVNNSNAIGAAFERLGYEVRKTVDGKYSYNHQCHVFLPKDSNPLRLYKNLINNNISTNFDDPLGGRVFIRIGTQEITRRGMKEIDMERVADYVDLALRGKSVVNEVLMFNKEFSKIYYSFDNN